MNAKNFALFFERFSNSIRFYKVLFLMTPRFSYYACRRLTGKNISFRVTFICITNALEKGSDTVLRLFGKRRQDVVKQVC